MYNTHIKCLLFVSNNFSKEFVVDFGGTPYYTHVLLPEDYLDVIDEGSKKSMNVNGGRDKMFKF